MNDTNRPSVRSLHIQPQVQIAGDVVPPPADETLMRANLPKLVGRVCMEREQARPARIKSGGGYNIKACEITQDDRLRITPQFIENLSQRRTVQLTVEVDDGQVYAAQLCPPDPAQPGIIDVKIMRLGSGGWCDALRGDGAGKDEPITLHIVAW